MGCTNLPTIRPASFVSARARLGPAVCSPTGLSSVAARPSAPFISGTSTCRGVRRLGVDWAGPARCATGWRIRSPRWRFMSKPTPHGATSRLFTPRPGCRRGSARLRSSASCSGMDLKEPNRNDRCSDGCMTSATIFCCGGLPAPLTRARCRGCAFFAITRICGISRSSLLHHYLPPRPPIGANGTPAFGGR